MNSKKAKMIRKTLRQVFPQIDTRVVRYVPYGSQGQTLVLDPSCFKGMYRLAKNKYHEEMTNV